MLTKIFELNPSALIVIVVVAPILVLCAMCVWLIVIARGKDSTTLHLSGFGVSLNMTASKAGVEKRTAPVDHHP